MWKSDILKSQSHNPNTPKYMEALSGENTDEYFKAMDEKVHMGDYFKEFSCWSQCASRIMVPEVQEENW